MVKHVKKRPRPQNSIQTQISERKAKRKEKRQSKKKKARTSNERTFEDWAQFHQQETQTQKTHKNEEVKADSQQKSNKSKSKSKPKATKQKKQKQTSKDSFEENEKATKKQSDIYDVVDENTAAAMRKDDEEIARLGEKLGLNKGKADKNKLNKEYAKLEGYGDDFGDFLDGLDTMLVNIAGDEEYDDVDDLEYDSDESDPTIARAKFLLRSEQLGLGVDEYEVKGGNELESDEESEDEPDEEMIPMKGPADEESSENDDESLSGSDHESNNDKTKDNEEVGSSEDSESENDSEEEAPKIERDHNERDTYRPIGGQDLYGNEIATDQNEDKKPSMYIPPHLRKLKAAENEATSNSKLLETIDNDVDRQQNLRAIQRLLNNNLNRLSDNTLESVAKSIALIYKSSEYSSRDVNDKYWKNVRAACVPPHMIMSSLIPIYMACVSGVHYQTGYSSQLNGMVTEIVVLELWEELKKNRESCSRSDPSSSRESDHDDPIHSSKVASNLMLIICYLYNYNTVHCSLMYDVVRRLIESFTEIDVELLLLILQHCGSQLRSDDPTALKDIVLLVQEKSMEVIKLNEMDQGSDNKLVKSSRAQFMIEAITDLKNNKRRNVDIAIVDKTSQYRRVIGRMKSASDMRGDTLRVSIQDILDIETKGRWWVVGGTWVGNQHGSDRGRRDKEEQEETSIEPDELLNSNNLYLKKLAAKQRMNTDLRRSIFFIIMGSDDCQDALEKLVRGALLKGKSEREVIRVLVHCCGQEKVYNPYYAHLANLICDHQNKSKFTFQLCLWDAFKQFEDMKARKAANLAKLMTHLVMNFKLNLNILKRIDISPDDMPENTIIFLTILFSNIFEECGAPENVVNIFQRGEPTKEQLLKEAEQQMGEDGAFAGSGRQGLKDSISIFLMHYLQNSPKNVKASSFRKNLKAAIKACEEGDFDYMM